MHVRTSHRIVKHGNDKMVLSDCTTGEAIVTAERRDASSWSLNADGAEDKTVKTKDNRAPVVDAMINLAFQLAPHDGISVFVPYKQLPDQTKLHLRHEA